VVLVVVVVWVLVGAGVEVVLAGSTELLVDA